jgi:3-hydroxy-3-methylglutaryl CoA synthase
MATLSAAASDSSTGAKHAALRSVGIKAYGAFIPRLRIARSTMAAAHAWAFPSLKAKGEKAMCNWDEDAITLAVEAGRDCLNSVSTQEVSSLTLASTTAPFADLQNAVIAASALRLGAHTVCSDASGSTRAGLSALAKELESGAGDHLVLASDRRYAKPASAQEMHYGSGAAALLVGEDDVIARFLGRHTVSVPFVDHFRESGQKYDYYWEERWIRDEGIARIVPAAVKSLLSRLSLDAARVAWFGLAGAPSGSDKLVAKQLVIDPERVLPDLLDVVGDTGTAHAPLLLIAALEKATPGDIIVIASFAQGCEVLAFEMQEPLRKPARGLSNAIIDRIAEPSYLKMLSFDGEIRLEWGPRAENEIKAALTQQYRSADQVLGFVGGKCKHCGAVQFPRLPTCIQCAALESQVPFPLADQPARVATFSADWLQYYPAPPLHVGLVQFDAGARVLMEMIEVGAKGIEVGTPLRMAFRVKAHDNQRHYGRYFWKAVPAV